MSFGLFLCWFGHRCCTNMLLKHSMTIDFQFSIRATSFFKFNIWYFVMRPKKATQEPLKEKPALSTTDPPPCEQGAQSDFTNISTWSICCWETHSGLFGSKHSASVTVPAVFRKLHTFTLVIVWQKRLGLFWHVYKHPVVFAKSS